MSSMAVQLLYCNTFQDDFG